MYTGLQAPLSIRFIVFHLALGVDGYLAGFACAKGEAGINTSIRPPLPLSNTAVHILYRRQNYRNCRLSLETRSRESVGVLMRNGDIKLVRWLGFITALDARERQDEVKPVKLVVSRIDGEDLQPGEYVQGCLDADGAWAVLDTSVRVIRTRSETAG